MLKPIDKLSWHNYDTAFKLLEYSIWLGGIFTNAGGKVEYHTDYDMSDGVCSFGNEAVNKFAERYNKREIAAKIAYESYLNEKIIQQFIEELEIDKDKLWFAVLFAHDYCTDLCDNGMVLLDSCYNELSKLVEIITKNINGWNSWEGAQFKSPLNLILSNGKKKEDVAFENPTTLYYIAEAIKDKMKSEHMEDYLTTNGLRLTNERTELIPSIKIAHFARMLLQLFDCLPQVVAKRKKGAKHSQKETDLVCQLIYFTGLSLNKRWKDVENDSLRSFLHQYKVPDNIIGTIYPTI